MPRGIYPRKHRGVTASVVTGEKSSKKAEAVGFQEQLEEEKQEAEEGKALKRELKRQMEADDFTKLLKEAFKLKGNPLFKTEFTDTRWPRMDNGQAVVVTRVYYPALEGPRSEFLGIRSLGERETENIRVIIDKIPKDKFWTEDRIMAKKWVCEQSGYRYFWVGEKENFEIDLEDKGNLFYKRFEALKTQPKLNFGPVKPLKDLHSEVYEGWQ